MTKISPLAAIDKKAQLADDVEVGPFCYVGPDVVLGEGCRLHNNVTVTGHTTIGPSNEFYPNSVIGAAPQDLKYRGEPTLLEMGSGNVLRELVTVHLGTEVGGGITRIGNDNRMLVGVHIAHDCQIGNACVVANGVQFAGHCCLEDHVNIGGMAGLHHFVTIGKYAFIGGAARVVMDIPPFVLAAGYDVRVRALNVEGLTRWGFTEGQIVNLRAAYRALFSKRASQDGASMEDRIAAVRESGHYDENVAYLCESVLRSTVEGVRGRYLESKRQDSSEDRKQYYKRVSEQGTLENSSDREG